MNCYQYYEDLKTLARQVRQDYDLSSPRVLRSDLRRIYSKNGIRIDRWPHKMRNLRGAYFNDGNGISVMVTEKLPPEPLIFTLCHEFKHHLVDSGMGTVYCDMSNQQKEIEIGAEVFAAELIFPDLDFTAWMGKLGVPSLGGKPQHLVKLKQESKTTLSYAGIRKKADFLKFIPKGAYLDVKWKKLEADLYGIPFHRQLHQRQSVAQFN